MKPTYTPPEARLILLRWACLLAACLAASIVANVSFSRYLLAQREGDPDTHLNRAESRMAALDLKGAMVSVENAMDRAPLYPRTHKVHGDILFKQEDWKEAEIAYKKCLDLGGDDPGVQNNVLWALIQQEAYEEAIVLGKQFMEKKDYSRLAPRYVAEACVRAGRWAEAAGYLARAIEVSPKDRYLLDLQLQAFNRLGRKDDADRVLARINEVELELEKEQQLTQRPAE